MTSINVELLEPDLKHEEASWLFARLPESASHALPSRGLVTVEGRINKHQVTTTLQPDGQGGHWLKLEANFLAATSIQPNQSVEFQFLPVTNEPEPIIPTDIELAISAHPAALETWKKTTAIARRDWIHWMSSGKKAETRIKRIETAVDMLAHGKKRACCFDRSGMYSKSLSCPKPKQ